jgi:hypothetical protein
MKVPHIGFIAPRTLFLLFFPFMVWASENSAPRDIFLLIGQSNMAGRAAIETPDRVPIPGVWALNRELKWQPATDPLHWDKPNMAGAGMGRSFARTLLALRPNTTIGLVPAAMGGSALDEWKPGAPLFKQAVERTRAALAGGGVLRGILWHQGESDTGNERLALTYDERWREMITTLRAELGAPNVSVIVGGLGEFVPTRRGPDGKSTAPFAEVVNEQLALLAVRVPRVAFVSAASLGHRGDLLHFDRAAQMEFGRRYAHAFLMLEAGWETMPVDNAVLK